MSQDQRKETHPSECAPKAKPGTKEDGSGREFIRTIRRKTRRKYSAEEKIRIVMEGCHTDDA